MRASTEKMIRKRVCRRERATSWLVRPNALTPPPLLGILQKRRQLEMGVPVSGFLPDDILKTLDGGIDAPKSLARSRGLERGSVGSISLSWSSDASPAGKIPGAASRDW